MNNQMLTECPMCYELYDEDQRIPRNLICGHTYCEYCLNHVYNQKLRIECPTCRCKHEPNLKPSQLSKNYIASDLAIKEKQSKSKYEFCDKHQEPLQFYCQDDNENICSDCIVEHSGHKFQKITNSIQILTQRVQDLGEQTQKKLDNIEKQKEDFQNLQNSFQNKKNENKKYVDEQFDKIIKILQDRKNKVYNEINEFFDTQQSEIDLQIAVQNSNQDIYKQQMENLTQIENQLKQQKFISNDEIPNKIKECQEIIEKENKQQMKQNEQNVCNDILNEESIPKISINIDGLINQISNLGQFQKIVDPKICFLGNKNQILQFDILKNEWCLNVLNNKYFELNFYASAVTLQNGDILIMGGGVSNKVYQVSVKRNFMVMQKSSMNQSRKEHASVIINKKVYVLGGFDSVNKQMLNSCEVYDQELDIWQEIAPMSKPKCALAVTQVNNKFIYVIGGFDGERRLNTIEKYDIENDKWSTLQLKLENPLSNAACIQVDKDNIIILGGGNDEGFSDQSMKFNIANETINQIPSMKEGRDLRNKLVKYKGKIYAIGGHNYLGSSFENISSYGEIIQDHLDSWSCAMCYSFEDDEDIAQYDLDKSHHIYHSHPVVRNEPHIDQMQQQQQQPQRYQQQINHNQQQQHQQQYYDYQDQYVNMHQQQGQQYDNNRNTNPIRPYNPNIHQFIYDNLPHHNIQGNRSNLYDEQQYNQNDDLPDIQDNQQYY